MTARKTSAAASTKTHRKTTKKPAVKTRGTPAYLKVAQHVKQMVEQGELAAGSMLPSERALASEFDVCHLTVRKGLALLVDEGLIERQVGQGTFVADPNKTPATATSGKGNAIALCVIESKAEMPMMGYAINGVRRVTGASRVPLEIIDYPRGGCTDELWNLLGDRVQGVVIQGYVSKEDIAQLNKRAMNFVSVGFQIGSDQAPWVHMDFDHMLAQIVEEAYRLGHRSIGIVGWESKRVQRAPDHANMPPMVAFAKACRAFDMASSAERIFKLAEVAWPDASLVVTRPVVEMAEKLPSVLIAIDEVMADALLRDFEAKGVRVPDDLSIVCLLDSTPMAHRMGLCGVDARLEYMAMYQKAAQMLLSQIQGKPLEQVQVVHQCKVHFKGSLAKAKS